MADSPTKMMDEGNLTFVSIPANHTGVPHPPLVVLPLIALVLAVVALRPVLLHGSAVVDHLLLLLLHGDLVVLPRLLLDWDNLLNLVWIFLIH